MKLLKAIFVLELILGCVWSIPFLASERPDEGVFYLLLLIYPIQLVFMLTSLWWFFKRPETRRLAVWVMLTPIVLLVLPGLFRGIYGGPILTGQGSEWKAIGLLLALLLGLFLLSPKKIVPYVPRFLVKSRVFNVGLMALLVLLLAGWGLLLRMFLDSPDQDSSGILTGFLLASGGVAAAISTLTFAYSYLGLFQSYDACNQRLRIAQLILSLPAPLVVVAAVLLLLIINPPI